MTQSVKMRKSIHCSRTIIADHNSPINAIDYDNNLLDPDNNLFELSGGVVVLPLTSHAEDWVFKPSLRQAVQATRL